MVTPAHRKGGSESSLNCPWLFCIPLVSLLFSYCSITLAFLLVPGCTELTYAVVCLLPRAQLSRVQPLQAFFPGHALDSSQFLPGPFLSWEFSLIVSYVFVYMSINLMNSRWKQGPHLSCSLLSVPLFSLLGLSRAFRQRCPTQEGGWGLGQSLHLSSVKTMLLLGDMDVSYSMWSS